METPASADTEPNALRAENLALRRELELLHDALERMPHGLCAFDGDDRLVLANAHYRKIWGLPEHVTRRGSTFRQIMDETPGRETAASRNAPQPAPGSEGTRWRSGSSTTDASWRSWCRAAPTAAASPCTRT